MPKYILGLDIGTASVGSALLRTNDDESEVELVDGGVYRFLDPYTEGDSPRKTNTTKNKQRGEARRARNLRGRKRLKFRALVRILQREDLANPGPDPFPIPDKGARSRFWPYDVWARAYDEDLTRLEFGKILSLLGQRRGFKSNLGAGLGRLQERPEIAAYLGEIEAEEARRAVEREQTTKLRGKKANTASEGDADEGKVLAQVGRWRSAFSDLPLGRFYQALLTPGDGILQFRAMGLPEEALQHLASAGSRMQVRNKASNPLWARPDREAYEREFDRLWERQAEQLGLPNELKIEIRHIIFHQNPLEFPADNRAFCEYGRVLVADTGESIPAHRAPKCSLIFQEYRLRKLLADMKLRDVPTEAFRHLTSAEKEKLFSLLNRSKSVSWSELEKKLGLRKGCSFEARDRKMKGSDYTDKGMQGNLIAGWFAGLDLKDTLRQLWENPERFLVQELKTLYKGKSGRHVRNHLIRILGEAAFKTHYRDGRILPKASLERVVELIQQDFRIDDESAFRLATAPMPPGFGSMSYEAMSRLLPHMRRGLMEHEALCIEYPPNRRENDNPDRAIVKPPEVRKILSPRVRKALNRVRWIVNALLEKHPEVVLDEIRIELARRMQVGNDKYAAELAHQAYNKRLADDARNLWNECRNEVRMPNNFVDKYKLWIECNYVSPYGGTDGRSISLTDLLTEGILEIEHIWPREIGGNSFSNKLLVFAVENQRKGGNGPWDLGEEWRSQVAATIARWPIMSGRSSDASSKSEAMPPPSTKAQQIAKRKRDRILAVHAPKEQTDFAERQAVETGYIAREAVTYLAPVARKITPIKATFSTSLARNWGLYKQLGMIHGDVLSGAPQDQKNRVLLRHHAVDALATALCSPRVIHRIAGLEKEAAELRETRKALRELNWQGETPSSDAEVREAWRKKKVKELRPSGLGASVIHWLDGIVVVSEPRHKPRGKFFLDQPLGLSKKQIERGDIATLNTWAKVSDLTSAQIFTDKKGKKGWIRSKLTQERIANYCSEAGFSDQTPNELVSSHIIGLPHGIPFHTSKGIRHIRKVKMAVTKNDLSNKFFRAGSNGGLALYPKIDNHCALVGGKGKQAWMECLLVASAVSLNDRAASVPYDQALRTLFATNSKRQSSELQDAVLIHKDDLVQIRPVGSAEWDSAIYRVEGIEPSRSELSLREHWSGGRPTKVDDGTGKKKSDEGPGHKACNIRLFEFRPVPVDTLGKLL